MNPSIRTLLVLAATLPIACGASAEEVASAGPSPATLGVPNGFLVSRADENHFDDTYQFIFFATLEGLYRDGVSAADVESLLATKKDGGYLNFIYTCPICMPVEGAIETYKLRPRIDHLKRGNFQTRERTFGFGLPPEISAALKSEKASIRLAAVNNLVSKWISYRLDHSGLSGDEKIALIEELKKRRKQGMEALQSFAKGSNGPDSMKFFAAGYEGEGDECAICNGALQMPVKLHDAPAEK